MAIHDLPNEELEKLYTPEFTIDRIAVAMESFYHFTVLYLSHRFPLAPAIFHRELIDALDSVDALNKYLAVIGFRGSAKSTILEAFALWSMINGHHNFIVYLGNTMDDSKMSLANIKSEIENNVLLCKDFKIVLDDHKAHGFTEKWSEGQITIGDCTMVAQSKGSKIRGSKFNEARIDLIIGDDLEDVEDAKTAEKRKKTREWFFSEVLPATKQGVLADHVKVVLIGNLVQRDCLLAHLAKGKIVNTLKFALLDENGNITWPALYPDMDAVNAEKEKVLLAGEGLGHVIWAREYLLKSVDEEDMVLKLEDILYYPDEWLQRKAESAGVGVDFAISKKQTADYTAMVKGVDVKNDEGEKRMLVMKGNVNERLGFSETISKAVSINEIMPQGTKFYPEKVMYQQSAIEIMEKNGIKCVPMTNTNDKKSRISSACFYVKNGRVLFPHQGAENVIENLIGFGIEDHDDLADAFANLVLGMVKKGSGVVFG